MNINDGDDIPNVAKVLPKLELPHESPPTSILTVYMLQKLNC